MTFKPLVRISFRITYLAPVLTLITIICQLLGQRRQVDLQARHDGQEEGFHDARAEEEVEDVVEEEGRRGVEEGRREEEGTTKEHDCCTMWGQKRSGKNNFRRHT